MLLLTRQSVPQPLQPTSSVDRWDGKPFTWQVALTPRGKAWIAPRSTVVAHLNDPEVRISPRQCRYGCSCPKRRIFGGTKTSHLVRNRQKELENN